MADMSTCSGCGKTEGTDDYHNYYGMCHSCVVNAEPSVSNQQRESNHPEVPQDRANDTSRRPGF